MAGLRKRPQSLATMRATGSHLVLAKTCHTRAATIESRKSTKGDCDTPSILLQMWEDKESVGAGVCHWPVELEMRAVVPGAISILY